jgi:orotate phosphoribosyltransferase
MPLFAVGAFTLHSGQYANFKIDCDSLTDQDISALAAKLAEILPPFGLVEGVPSGGLRLAAAMEKYAGGPAGRLLIVDDVLSTGVSMEEQRAGREAYGAVVFCRGATWPSWVTPLFVMRGTPAP